MWTVEVIKGERSITAPVNNWEEAHTLMDKVLVHMLKPEHYEAVKARLLARPTGIMCICAETWALTAWPGERPVNTTVVKEEE